MRRKLLSLALGAGLLAGTATTTLAQTDTSAAQACAGFVNEMGQTWSTRGYASLENAVRIEGGDWFSNTCLGGGALAQTTGTYAVPNDPLVGQPAQVTNQVEQNGTAFGGAFGSGLIEDDESNGSVITQNDAQGGEEDDDENED